MIKVVNNIYPSGHESGNVYDPNGESPTLKCNGPRANLKKASPLIMVKALTEIPTDEAKEIRKKNMKEGKDYSPRRGKELKLRDDDNANTVTSTQGVEQLIVLQKTHGCTTTIKNNETGTLQRGGSNVMDKVPNIVIQLNTSLESNGSQPYQQNRIYDIEGIMPTLSSGNGDNTTPKISTPNHGRIKGREYENEVPTLQQQMGTGGDNIPYVNNIRRLTEIECERLQGYKDNWTKFGNYDGKIKEISRTSRYKLCGNAVTVDIVELIGRKLLEK